MTYRINTRVGGPMARWLPSIEVAKERYLECVREAHDAEDGPLPEITFEVSRVDEDGAPCAEHVRILQDGNLDSIIWPELPEWPDPSPFPHGPAPDLVLTAASQATACTHRRLVCTNVGDYREVTPRPVIRCSDCATTWAPEGS